MSHAPPPRRHSRQARAASLPRFSALAAVLLLGCAGADSAYATHHARRPHVAGARVQSAALQADASSAQLTVQLSGKVAPKVYQLQAPARVVIDLPATVQQGRLRLPAASGLIANLRAAPHGALYRLVLELRAPLGAAPVVSASSSAAGYELRVRLATLEAALRNAPHAESGGTPEPATTDSPAEELPAARTVRPEHMPSSRDIVVAVDAGHGGDDPGASGREGTHEKDVVLAIARALAARLNERPGMRAVLTRDADRLIDLRERFERARAAHADLFVSIHADAVRDRSIAGASVYTLSYRGASSEAARRLADHENALVLKGGTSLANVDPALASVLLDVSQEANMGASVEAADAVLNELDRVGAVRKKLVQHAAFVVLKSPDLPSMLVETAYISNPTEERKLRSAPYQSQLAAAIEAGVVAYFRSHPPDGTAYTARLR
jgi:N-acetylmuramoyl-L-alanine amidase